MTYVIRRTDQKGGWVTPPGSPKSYTKALQCARHFASRAEAEAERCPGNEVVQKVDILENAS